MRTPTKRVVFGLTGLIVLTGVIWLSLDWLGAVAFRRGLKAKTEWKISEAISYFGWASSLQRSNSLARLELGVCEQWRGDFLASQKHLDNLAKAKIDDPAISSRLHNAIGVNHYSFNEPDSAIEAHQKALDLARKAGHRGLEAEALIDLSRVYYHSKGRFDEALANLKQALVIAREIADERIEAAAMRNLGVVHWWFKGELERPLNEFYFPALDLYRRQNDQRGAATMLTLLALVYNNKGDIYNFMKYQNEGLEIQERIGDQAGLSDSYMTLGILYNGIGNYRKAREFFSKGLTITERTGYRLAGNDLHSLLADVQLNLGEYDEALRLYDPELKHKDPNSTLSNYLLQYIAHCYQLKGDYSQALFLYERALQVHAQSGTPDVRFKTNTLLRSAECAIALGDWERASKYWNRASEDKGETHSEGETRSALVRAALARHDGRHKDALKYLQHALDVEEQIFASAKTNLLIPPHPRSYEMLYGFLLDYAAGGPDARLTKLANEILFGFLENMRYRALRNFLVQIKERRLTASADEKELALNEQIKKLSQDLKASHNEATREQLRKAYHEYEEVTLKSQLQLPQYLAISAAMPVELVELKQKLPVGTALVEFLILSERVLALTITKHGAQTVELPIHKKALAAKTKLFRSLVFGDTTNEDVWLPVAQSLRASLIDPLEASGAFTNIDTLGLVPFGLLHDLPFAALAKLDNGNVRFLVEDYFIFQTPSATFFAHKSSDAGSETPMGTIAFGRNLSTDKNLPNLAFAAEEAYAVAQIAGGQAFVNESATETELKRQALDAGYLHLSTHGVAESEMPLFSRVLLEPTATDDGNLTVREIFELGLRTRLVTLSACETGQSFSAGGSDLVEQDRIGLIEAFLQAGSRGVVATLLPVSDKSTLVFMKYFYGRLANKEPAAKALTDTQRAMLRGEIALSPGLNARHPRYWAPFMIVGNPR